MKFLSKQLFINKIEAYNLNQSNNKYTTWQHFTTVFLSSCWLQWKSYSDKDREHAQYTRIKEHATMKNRNKLHIIVPRTESTHTAHYNRRAIFSHRMHVTMKRQNNRLTPQKTIKLNEIRNIFVTKRKCKRNSSHLADRPGVSHTRTTKWKAADTGVCCCFVTI